VGTVAIRDGDAEAAARALKLAQKLRRIAYLCAAAAAYQGDPGLNPEQETDDSMPQERSCSPASGRW
jgi:hypothetical protein